MFLDKEKEEKIIENFYVLNRTKKEISEELKLPLTVVDKFLREHKLSNYTDKKIQELARSEEYNALSVINTFFDAAGFGAEELAFCAILARMLREKIAGILAEGGVTALFEHPGILKLWYENTDKLSKLAANAPKYLDAYVNLYKEVLDIQRQVSHVKAVTDILQKTDPRLSKLIRESLDRDQAAKAVLGSLDSQKITDYWANELSIPGKAKQALESAEEDQ